MSSIVNPTSNVALLQLLESRVQTGLLVQIANTADNNVNTLRNDEAPVLGVAVPVASA